MDAILYTLSLVMNENRRNKVFTMIKQLQMREHSAHTDFSIKCYVLVILIFNVASKSNVFYSERCDIFRDAVDVTSSTTRQRDSNVPAFIYTECIGEGYKEIFP